MIWISPNTWFIRLGLNNKPPKCVWIKKDSLKNHLMISSGWWDYGWFGFFFFPAFFYYSVLTILWPSVSFKIRRQRPQHGYLPYTACTWSVHLTSSFPTPVPTHFYSSLTCWSLLSKSEAPWGQGQPLLASISRAHNFLSIIGTH